MSLQQNSSTLNINKIRADFPILNQQVHGKPLVYFDNGATTQKPTCVLDTIGYFYNQVNSNIHRGVHKLSDESTRAYEEAREVVRSFINAKSIKEIVFTSGTTASINLVAFSFGEAFISEGDEVIVSEMEHHSNIVPWQLMCERKKATLKVLPFDDNGEVEVSKLDELITDRTKILAVTHVSNTLGTVNPIKNIIAKAHSRNVKVLIDGAQGVKHGVIDVQALDADFYVFSGHKLYGPTGIGVLYGKEELLEQLPPWQGGGDMIATVSFTKTVYNELPFKFEAGTANYIGAAGLATAIKYYQSVGIENAVRYETELLEYATQQLLAIDGVRIYGTAKEKASIISFVVGDIHPYDTGMILDKMGIAVRTGTHCTEPVMAHFGIDGTVRASLAFYNTREEIDKLIEGVTRVKMMFG
ncbi:cysteine desulfurase [Perlabentimonas gracilis]|uniref:cysteine desulfurase n=1 Tax=Perlabentimonas gracilis TaxID=2715279 RepID=UPI0014098838|nr:cysteine desulfurase [Perlabentimonas gracilis]NHB69902.1 cysteine desulfurase [Perlabentimonas gracilis]